MKKYWKIITLAAIIVLSIGTFYFHSAVYAINLPQFVIKKQSGNDALVHSVVIDGQFHQGSMDRNISITSKGSTYDNQLSSNIWFGKQGPIIKQLIKNHRRFMRRKALNVSSYFENQINLVYATIDYSNALIHRKPMLSISVLNKKKGRTQSFKIPIPNSDIYKYISVQDVQWMKGMLEICTLNQRDSSEEVHVYTIKKKQLISDKMVLSAPSKIKGGFASIGFPDVIDSTQSNSYEVFVRRDDIQKPGKKNLGERHTLFAYNLKTKVKKKIPARQNVQVASNPMPVQAISGSTVYLRSPDEKNVIITPYHLDKGKFGNSIKIMVPTDETSRPPEVKIHNHYVYVLFYVKGKTAAFMTVTDLHSGKVLYKGEVTETKQSSHSKYRLFFYGFEFQ